jgi:hypothetical protein
MLVPVLRAKKIEKLALFLSQHLTNYVALPIRDVAISEKLLVQRNIFLVDKYIEGNHYAPPLPQYQTTISVKIRNCTQLSTRRRERDNFGASKATLSKSLLGSSLEGVLTFTNNSRQNGSLGGCIGGVNL